MNRVYYFQRPNTEQEEVEIHDSNTWKDVIPYLNLGDPGKDNFWSFQIRAGKKDIALNQEDLESDKTFSEYNYPPGTLIKAVPTPHGAFMNKILYMEAGK